MISEELRAFVLSRPGVVAEISGRFHPAPLPDAVTLPAVTYTDVSEVPSYTNEGESAYTVLRYQIDSWAADRTTARRVADALRAALAGFIGVIGKWTIGAIIRRLTFTRYEPDVKLWRTITDYEILVTGGC